jgi:cell division protein FtsQ
MSLCLPLVLLGSGLGGLIIWSKEPDRFPLKALDVQGELKSISEQDIKSLVLPFLPEGFFWVNVQAIQQHVKELPWVETADVRRVWPDRISVQVKEKIAQARWGEKGVLSTEGDVFYPKALTIPSALPRFDGPDKQAKEVLQQYFTLLELLGPLGLRIQGLVLSPEGSWQAVLDNGITLVLGKTALSERTHRFVLAYQSRLQPESGRIAYVDLRYTNGFAIGWKTGAE